MTIKEWLGFTVLSIILVIFIWLMIKDRIK